MAGRKFLRRPDIKDNDVLLRNQLLRLKCADVGDVGIGGCGGGDTSRQDE